MNYVSGAQATTRAKPEQRGEAKRPWTCVNNCTNPNSKTGNNKNELRNIWIW